MITEEAARERYTASVNVWAASFLEDGPSKGVRDLAFFDAGRYADILEIPTSQWRADMDEAKRKALAGEPPFVRVAA